MDLIRSDSRQSSVVRSARNRMQASLIHRAMFHFETTGLGQLGLVL